MKDKMMERLAAISMIVFPVLLLIGFLFHPDILSLRVTSSAEDLVANFHGRILFHAGHLIVFLAVPFIIFSLFYFMTVPVQQGRKLIITGGIAGIFGAVILAGDKGALCIVLSAFDTLSEKDFMQIYPALTAIVERRGLLALFYLLPLLTFGAALQIAGLIRGNIIKASRGIPAIVGLLMLNNPDIEIISSIGAVLMGICYIPEGVRILKNRF
jgi:hypothetical protein